MGIYDRAMLYPSLNKLINILKYLNSLADLILRINAPTSPKHIKSFNLMKKWVLYLFIQLFHPPMWCPDLWEGGIMKEVSIIKTRQGSALGEFQPSVNKQDGVSPGNPGTVRSHQHCGECRRDMASLVERISDLGVSSWGDLKGLVGFPW